MKLGIIGGSGLYQVEGFEELEQVKVATPFGPPSDRLVHCALDGREVYFLPRHGRGHRIPPHELNHRANIFAFKKLGVERIVSVSAVGSLREDFRPRDIVIPDQFFDRTKNPDHSFFGGGIVAHVGFGDPVCAALCGCVADVVREHLAAQPAAERPQLHPQATYVNMQGPQFSTRAESNVYRKLGFDVVGMTSMAEAKLCREAEICYTCIAMVTDYDCWHQTHETVSIEQIIAVLQSNVRLAKDVVRTLARRVPAVDCACHHALANAIMTDPKVIPAARIKDLQPLIGKYIPAPGAAKPARKKPNARR